jgi:hypothetical protein
MRSQRVDTRARRREGGGAADQVRTGKNQRWSQCICKTGSSFHQPTRVYSVAVIIQDFHSWDGGSTLPGLIFLPLGRWARGRSDSASSCLYCCHYFATLASPLSTPFASPAVAHSSFALQHTSSRRNEHTGELCTSKHGRVAAKSLLSPLGVVCFRRHSRGTNAMSSGYVFNTTWFTNGCQNTITLSLRLSVTSLG